MNAAAAALALLVAGLATPASARSGLGCMVFVEAFTHATTGHKIVFERPLNITRGFGGEDGDLDVRVLATGPDDVEGTLKCKGDLFRRFELRIRIPADDPVIAAFKFYREATLSAAFGWDRSKVQTVAAAISSDAADYLHGSIQRGDTYVAGKVEYHQGDALDLGEIWTEDERTLVITTQSE